MTFDFEVYFVSARHIQPSHTGTCGLFHLVVLSISLREMSSYTECGWGAQI